MLFTLFGDYVHPLGGREVWVGALVTLAGEFGITSGSLRSAVSRMGREGWLSKRTVAGRPWYGLSRQGRELIEEGTRRIYRTRGGAWDGQWLVVAYSGAGSRAVRDRLRTELTFLGFGSLGAGLYVSPHDLRPELAELTGRHGVREVLGVRGPLALPGDPTAVVRRAWDLDGLARRYRAYISETERARRQDAELAGDGTLAPARAFRRRFLLTHRYRHFPYSDPDLPSSLLPAGWPGTRAHQLFLDYNALLLPGAEQHYREVVDVANHGRTTIRVT